MKRVYKLNSGVSNSVFGVTAIVLLIAAVVGFGLYASKSPATITLTTTQEMTSGSTVTTTEMMISTQMENTSMMGSSNHSGVTQMTPVSGQMIHSAWFVTAPLGMMNEWVVVTHAEGLESTNGTNSYLIEAAQKSGGMSEVPITNSSGTSEFQTNSNGTGTFWATLNVDPLTSFESVEIVYLPGMSMSNATVVANATLTMVH